MMDPDGAGDFMGEVGDNEFEFGSIANKRSLVMDFDVQEARKLQCGSRNEASEARVSLSSSHRQHRSTRLSAIPSS